MSEKSKSSSKTWKWYALRIIAVGATLFGIFASWALWVAWVPMGKAPAGERLAALINAVCGAQQCRDGVGVEQQHLKLRGGGVGGVGARGDAARRRREREVLVERERADGDGLAALERVEIVGAAARVTH